MQERWRPIPGYEGKYEASNLGRIRSVDRYEYYTGSNGSLHTRFRKGSVIHAFDIESPTRSGHVYLSKDSKALPFVISKIIAEVWVKNPHNYSAIRHKDGNKQNHAASNLKWVPYSNKSKITSTEWRPVPGYEGLYEVSKGGKIRSVSRSVTRTRVLGDTTFSDAPQYLPVELKPYGITRKGIKYHLHKRTKSGYYGQTDEYVYGHIVAAKAFADAN